jgi:hypothetical protein
MLLDGVYTIVGIGMANVAQDNADGAAPTALGIIII